MSSLLQYSVWASDAIPPEEWKYRNLTRMVFPVIYALLFVSGFTVLNIGIPAINEFFPSIATPIFAIALILSAGIALVGVCFPRHWRLEMTGGVALFGLLIAYLASLIILIIADQGNRSFLSFIATVSIVPIVWRLSILGSEWQTLRIADPTNDQGKED